MKFQKATQKDKKVLLEFMEDFYALDEYPFDKKITSKNLNRVLKNPQMGKIWIINDKKFSIGYFILTFVFSFEYGGVCAYIDEIYIHDAFRNQGIGTEAMKFIMNESKKLKVQLLFLEVEHRNSAAKKVYEKFGFTENRRSLMVKKI
jgi:ribosomal protein S18 acetylase RimI-like enzyme